MGNLKMGLRAFRFCSQLFVAFGYLDDHFSVTESRFASSGARYTYTAAASTTLVLSVFCFAASIPIFNKKQL